ncbi:MAG: heat shock protein HspQ [Pseudomonadota bacterium]
MKSRNAKFGIGAAVRHRLFPFRGIVFDIDPTFDSSEEWYRSIPEDIRPPKDQPFYHVLAENSQSEYVAYVSEQNLVEDTADLPIEHSQLDAIFDKADDGRYIMRTTSLN